MRSNAGFESNRPSRGRQRSQFRQKTNGRGQGKGTPNKDHNSDRKQMAEGKTRAHPTKITIQTENKWQRARQGHTQQRSQFRQKTNDRGQDKGTPNKDRRPLGSQNFLPTCFGCQGKGHMIKDCPDIVQPQCYKCHKYGHISKNCPN